MKLSDIMSAADLAIYAEVGLLLFMGVFVAVALKVYLFSEKGAFDEVAQIPLREEPVSGRFSNSPANHRAMQEERIQ